MNVLMGAAKRERAAFYKTAAALVETGVIALIIGEIAAAKFTPQLLAPPRTHFRNYTPACFVPSDTLPYDIMPHCRDRIIARDFRISFNTNNLGFRDDDVAPKKENEFRILVVGDSFTAGWGVEQDDAFPNVLERMLNERSAGGAVFNVINAGYQAQTFDTYYLFLKNEGLALNPDLVVVTIWLGNDLVELYSNFWDGLDSRGLPLKIDGYNRIRKNHHMVLRYVPFKYRYWPLNRSHLFVFLMGMYEWKILKGHVTGIFGELNDEYREKYRRDCRVLERFHGGAGPGVALEEVKACPMIPYPDNKPEYAKYTWLKTAATLEAISSLAKENGAGIYFMNIPVRTYDAKRGCHLSLIRKLMKNIGAPFLDLTPRFGLPSGKIDQKYYYVNDGHFMREGQRIIAGEMRLDMLKRGILH
ncbi:MAG: hypothetical protein AB1742_15525 [bacterium]